MRGDRLVAIAALVAAGCLGGSDSGAQLFPMGMQAPAPETTASTGGEGDPPTAVGVYRGPDTMLLLDADGGYEWRHAGATTRGRWRMVAGDAVELAPAGGAGATRIALREDSVVDPTGVELRAARP